jgi:putative drug exporter of the RND superfamily
MNKVRGIISLPAGRRAKWIVLAGWLIVVAVAGPLAGKLGSAEQNDAKSWLPATAESTRVLDLQSRVKPPNVYPAVVIYDRPSGITAADRAQAAADIDRFAGVSGV